MTDPIEPDVSPEAVAAYVAIALEDLSEKLRRMGKPIPRQVGELAAMYRAWARPGGTAVVQSVEEPPRLLTYAQVGHMLGGRSEKTVQRLVRDGELKAVWIGSRPRVHVDDLDAYLDALRSAPVDSAGPCRTNPPDNEDVRHPDRSTDEERDSGQRKNRAA